MNQIDKMAIKLALTFACIMSTVYAQVFQCTFESDTCGMAQDKLDSPDRNTNVMGDFDWARRNGATPTSGTGPDSGQETSGYYIYAETSDPQMAADEARITTPALDYVGSVCVHFYYHMYGNDMGTLKLYRQSDSNDYAGTHTDVWSMAGDQGNVWKQVSVDVDLSTSSEMIGWTCIKGRDYMSDTAIDSIKIEGGKCSGGESSSETLPWQCDFESDSICSMRQKTDDDFDWTRRSGATPSSNTGPDAAQSATWYMFIETSDPRREDHEALLETPSIAYTGEACVEFYYHLNGNDVKDLAIYTTGRGSQSPLMTFSGNKGNTWILGNVTVPINNDRVGFLGRRGKDVQGDIAIDNVKITQGACLGSTGKLPFKCDFENDFCEMTQRSNDDFDWLRRDSATPTDGTGPSGAKSWSWFIYTEMSAPRVEGDKAYLDTPNLNFAGSVCITFYYHMYGIDMGRLVVFTSWRGEEEMAFMRSGDRGDTWQLAAISTSIRQDESIVFLGVRGKDVRGDIAIDQLEITAGSCSAPRGNPKTGDTTPSQPTQTTTPSRTTKPTTTTTTTSGGSATTPQALSDYFSCDIESDARNDQQCRIRQDTNDDFDWTRGISMTPSGLGHKRRIDGRTYPVTGPEYARSGSYYLYGEASGRSDQQVARLVLEGDKFQGSGTRCLRFAYSLNGYHMGQIRVFVRINGGQRTYKWFMSGDHGKDWHRASVQLDMSSISEIGFEGQMTGEFSSDMALDEIDLISGSCQQTPSNYMQRCTFEMDDGSSTMCSMEQDVDDTFDWTLRSGATPSDQTGPSSAYSGQYYIYIEASKPRRQGDEARILLPRIGSSGEVCVDFRYHMYGYHIGRLEVYIRRGSSNLFPAWSLAGQQGNQWQQKRLTIYLEANDKIGFRGVREAEFSGDIALDSITVQRNPC